MLSPGAVLNMDRMSQAGYVVSQCSYQLPLVRLEPECFGVAWHVADLTLPGRIKWGLIAGLTGKDEADELFVCDGW